MMRPVLGPFVGVCALGACALGPDYQGPPIVAPRAENGAAFVRAAPGVDAPALTSIGAWIAAFDDPVLDELIDDALTQNADLAAAIARVRSARAGLREARRRSWPTGAVTAGYERTQPSYAGFDADALGIDASDLDLYDAALDVRWELDLFGRRAREREAARARAAAAAFDYFDVASSLAAETGFAYVELRAAEERFALAEAAARLHHDLADLVALREANGADSRLDLDRALYLSAQTSAALPELRAQIDLARDRLAVLTGREPGALDARLALGRQAVPQANAIASIGDAGTLLRRRPDVRAAERRLQAVHAGIGAAAADFFPRVELVGSIGGRSNRLDGFGADAFTYRVGPRLEWSILEFEALSARLEQARARNAEAVAAYRSTVLAALGDVEGALVRYDSAQRRLGLVGAAREHAASAAQRADLRYRSGAASLLEALEAERDRLEAENALVNARADLALTHVALAKSLGLAIEHDASGVHDPA